MGAVRGKPRCFRLSHPSTHPPLGGLATRLTRCCGASGLQIYEAAERRIKEEHERNVTKRRWGEKKLDFMKDPKVRPLSRPQLVCDHRE